MHWTVEYWAEQNGSTSLVEWFDSLNQQQFKSVAKELKLLERCGNTLRLPHSKALGQGLFELRERNYGFRVYYGFKDNRIIVLLNAGDKSDQQKSIKIARSRLMTFK